MYEDYKMSKITFEKPVNAYAVMSWSNIKTGTICFVMFSNVVN